MAQEMLTGIRGGGGEDGEGDLNWENAKFKYRFSFSRTSQSILYSLICPSALEISKKAIEYVMFFKCVLLRNFSFSSQNVC